MLRGRPLPPQVKVMLRVWPAQGAQRSAESAAFLKVDPRKKQVTLYDPAPGPPGSTGPRRAATTAVPRMFAFDAVFPQDSEQVSLGAGPGPRPVLLRGREEEGPGPGGCRAGPGGSLPPAAPASRVSPAVGLALDCFPGKHPPSPGALGPSVWPCMCPVRAGTTCVLWSGSRDLGTRLTVPPPGRGLRGHRSRRAPVSGQWG